MSARQHILAKRFLRAFVCLSLAFGLSLPATFAYSDEKIPSIDIEKHDIDGVNDDNCSYYIAQSNNISHTANDDSIVVSDGVEDTVDPSIPHESDPVSPAIPQGPLTFKFYTSTKPVIDDIEQVPTGLMLTWSYSKEADGYIILRRKEGSGINIDEKYEKGLSKDSLTLDSKYYKKANLNKTGWEYQGRTTSSNSISWVDKKVSCGQMYEYVVIAYIDNKNTLNNNTDFPYIPSYAKNRDLSRPSHSDIGFRMDSPIFLSIKQSSKTMTIRWNKIAYADGYIVECSKNSAFAGKKRKVIKGKANVSTTIKNLSKSINYCVRIRAYADVYDGRKYSTWNGSYFTTATKKASLSRITYKYKVKKELKKTNQSNKTSKKPKYKYIKKTKIFELREQARQKMGQYDTMQGGCSDGKYMYFVMLNKLKNRCKIAKVRIKTRRVIKISKPLKLNHGNGITYNSNTRHLVVAHGSNNGNTISEINKNSLKIIKTRHLKLPLRLKGASSSQLKAYKGVATIAYSKKEDVYACLLLSSHNVILLDSDFKMLKYLTLSKKMGQISQSIEVVNDCILVGESFGNTKAKAYNIVSVYNWDGKYMTTTRLQKAYELENFFAVGNQFYAGFYRSYIKSGKFMKDNYVYRINSF